MRGPLYWLKWLVSYAYLIFRRRLFGRRLNLYDLTVDGYPEKFGFFVPHLEWSLETPQDTGLLKEVIKHFKKSDIVYCMGVNSHYESLAVRIVMQGNGSVQCSLILRLGNGTTYTLPPEHSIQTQTDEPHVYGSSRIKMECLLPMRKWRLFFNGILRETSDNEEDQTVRYRHVRFSFIWTASSDVFDFTCDMSQSLCANTLAKHSSWRCTPTALFGRLQKMFDIYEQCGMLLGTVTVEGESEKELYLWGNRGHDMGCHSQMHEYRSFEVFLNCENGSFIRTGIIDIPGFINNFPYGYVMKANGFICPVDDCTLFKGEEVSENEMYLTCTSDKKNYPVKLSDEHSGLNICNSFSKNSSVIFASGLVNQMTGRGLVFERRIQHQHRSATEKQSYWRSVEKQAGMHVGDTPVSVAFDVPCCQELFVSGGKGSSLGKLTLISKKLRTFIVPKGIVVTTSAYKYFTQGILHESLRILQKAAWSQEQVKSDINSACESVQKEILKREFPENVKQSIESSLFEAFGKDVSSLRFAVRSSSTGEDTEQMSAAGQMETFLGCKGIPEILNAVKKCWASQFSFVAMEYKRHYGQLLNSPMAVVIQEMVPCEVAGVAFTCDPVTGNPSYICITANYGLGESVVSAAAEPDTLTLKRDITNKLQFHSKTVGVKQMKIVMDESGGTKEVKMDQESSAEYSVSEDMALALGAVLVQIEMESGAPRDVEWGVFNKKIFLFQARPVTTIDAETDFEKEHIFDSYLRREDEYITKANIGEVVPGATSPLGAKCMQDVLQIGFARQKYVKWEGELLPASPYFDKRMVNSHGHLFLNLIDAFCKFSGSNEEEISNYTKSMTISLFGRVIEDNKLFEIAKDRHGSTKSSGTSIAGLVYIFLYMVFGEYLTKRVKRKMDVYSIPIEENASAFEMLHSISLHFHEIYIALNHHTSCSLAAPFWNLSMLGVLSKASGVYSNEVFRDYAYLLSSCKHVESADIPATIQNLGATISRSIDPEEFKSMNADDALRWLQTSSSEAGRKFRNFLIRHGHRCVKECDSYSKTWAMEPRPLVKTLQTVISAYTEDHKEDKPKSFQDIVSNLVVKLNRFQRLKLRFLLPQCRRGIREREITKSLAVASIDKLRQASYQLADAMVSEGRLPSRDLLFFLYPEEIRQLIKTRSPKLVTRALGRWKRYPEMDKLIFPEIVIGIPKPVNMNEKIDISGDGFSMTGVPVSQGVIKGIARVIMNIQEAPSIQHGDILITYSTDTAWSPYFPLLSGVVTELGGLISHGAVVAREYGLPCVVSVYGATRAFKSGDFVLLDGNRGILQKIEQL